MLGEATGLSIKVNCKQTVGLRNAIAILRDRIAGMNSREVMKEWKPICEDLREITDSVRRVAQRLDERQEKIAKQVRRRAINERVQRGMSRKEAEEAKERAYQREAGGRKQERRRVELREVVREELERRESQVRQ